MERYYRLALPRRLVNVLVRPLIRYGVALRHTYLLTVPGRKTGRPYSTPVTLVENGGRWLVAPYGERNWVKNARAAGWAELSRGTRKERFRIQELKPAESGGILRRYLEREPVTRPFFEARPGDPIEAFEREAQLHPVFRLVPIRAAGAATSP